MCGRTTKFCGPVASAWILMDILVGPPPPFFGQTLPFTGSLQVSVRPTFVWWLAPKNEPIFSTQKVHDRVNPAHNVNNQCLIGELLRAGHLGFSKLFHPRWRPDELVYLVSPVEIWSGHSSNQPKSTMNMHYSPKLVLDCYRRGYFDLYTWD